MRVLHLYSNYKWTGPSEPVANLVRALRNKGLDVRFACRRAPEPHPRTLPAIATQFGLDPILDFHLDHTRALSIQTLQDCRRIRAYLIEQHIDIVHTHRSYDHAIGGYAARHSTGGTLVVRTNHKGVPLRLTGLARLAFRRYTDAYVGFSRVAAGEDQKTFDIPEDRVFVINPALDLDRFDPSRTYADIRPQLGLTPELVVAGIVARVQLRRRWETLLAALMLAAQRAPQLRFLIIGRGTNIEVAAKKPVIAMGLSNIVLFPGYRTDDYVDYLSSLDFKVFLVPGSDGTCRAAREAMAMGKPVIAARRGMLPELIPHERAGFAIDDTPENLADAMVRLTQDTSLRKRLGEGARQHALKHFRLDDQVEGIVRMYEQLMRVKSQ